MRVMFFHMDVGRELRKTWKVGGGRIFPADGAKERGWEQEGSVFIRVHPCHPRGNVFFGVR
jgi:hypothetical protein